MLRRVGGMPRGVTLRALAVALGSLGMGACAGDDDPTRHPLGVAAHAPAADDWSARLTTPTVPDLLAALARPHAALRERVGPHALTVTTDFTLDPVGEPPALHPRLDAPVVTAQSVHDELALRWAPSPNPRSATFALSQRNDHDRGRDVVVVGQTVHVRQAYRPWFHYARDSDVVEQWLDDAQRAVHDAVELAAPRLQLEASTHAGAGLEGGPAVEIALALAETSDPGLRAAGPTQAWRARAEILAVDGIVRLDAVSGAWLSATVDVAYGLPGADGRPLRGRLRMQAQLAPGDPGPIEAPPESQPLPQRLRYDDEQRRLLDGLAAP
jgi:hypothetical protein